MSELKEITVNIGMSVDKNGLWVKVGAGATITVDKEDATAENRTKLFERAYGMVSEEIDAELERLGISK